MVEKHLVLGCKCTLREHEIHFQQDEDNIKDGECVIYSTLNAYMPWYKRVALAVRYIFGIDTHSCHYDETLVDIAVLKHAVSLLEDSRPGTDEEKLEKNNAQYQASRVYEYVRK